MIHIQRTWFLKFYGKRPPAKQVALNLSMESLSVQYRLFRVVYASSPPARIDAARKICIDPAAAVPATEKLAPPFTGVMSVGTGKRTGYGTHAVANRAGLLHGLRQPGSLPGLRAQLYFQDQFQRLLSFQLTTLAPGSTGYHGGGPSSAAMIAPPSARYPGFEKCFGLFFGLLSHQTPVRNRTLPHPEDVVT